MPQVIAAALVSIGLSALAAAIISTVILFVAVLLLKPGTPKPDPAERSVKSPAPARIYVLGCRRVYSSQMLFVNGNSRSSVDVFAFAEGPVNAVIGTYLNDDLVTVSGGFVQEIEDGGYKDNHVKAGWNLGPTPGTGNFAAVLAETSEWTSNHRGDGIVAGYLIKRPAKSKEFLDVYPQGDNINMSLVIEGRFMHDPRDEDSDPEDPSTWPYSENAVLGHLWYYMAYRGFSYADKIAPVEEYWITAADICDEAIALDGGGTEERYRIALLFSGEMQNSDIENEIRATYDGWTAEDANGCIRVYAGKLYTPTVTLTVDDVIDYQIARNVPSEDRLNEIVINTISADHDYNSVQCEEWRDEDDILENGLNNTNLTYQVPSYSQGRRLAKRQMSRVNAPLKGSIRTKRSGIVALGERYINLVITEAGSEIVNERVEIIGGERDYATGGCTFEFVGVDPNVDAWNAESEQGIPAPTVTKPYLPPLAAPVIDSATAIADVSGTRVQIVAEDPGVEGVEWFSRWRVVGTSSWVVESQTSEDLTFLTGIVPFDADIEVGIQYEASGSQSPWSATEEVGTDLPT